MYRHITYLLHTMSSLGTHNHVFLKKYERYCHPPFLGKKPENQEWWDHFTQVKTVVGGRRLNPSIAHSLLCPKAHHFSSQVDFALGGRGWY